MISNILYLTGTIFNKVLLGQGIESILSSNESFIVKECISINKKWKYFIFISKFPFLNEEYLGPYSYKIYFRESNENKFAIILAHNRQIITGFLNTYRHLNLFKPISIRTDGILLKIKNTTCNYHITFVHGRVIGMHQSINAMSLYGKDILDSPIYNTYVENIEPIACGISLPDNDTSNNDYVRFTNDGNISFPFRSAITFDEIDKLLNFNYEFLTILQ